MRFFFDRNMPPQLARMVDALEREHTARSYYDDDRFTDTTPDIEWITGLAADDPPWIVISGDERILKNKTELSALREAKLTFFCLSKQWMYMKIAHDGLQGGANNWPIRAPNSLLPRARMLCTNSKNPRYKGRVS